MEIRHRHHSSCTTGNVETGIAIIGMAGRFPDSPGIDVYWDNLKNGRDCISENPRFQCRDVSEARWGGFIDDPGSFDNDFFKISTEDARQIDPRQRLFLEVAWHALEDGGYGGTRLYGSPTGVFVGCVNNQYVETFYKSNIRQKSGLFNTNASIANRLSYFMNFKGPSMSIDTTCSSSGTALHQACRSLQNNECSVAIAGGVQLLLSPDYFIALGRMGVLSKTGQTCVLGGRANGFVLGEGVGAVVLKPLRQALKDRDHIYAVIKGTGINYSGHTRHLTSPNPYAQKELVVKTLNAFDVSPESLQYIEVNGSGIGITDALEIQALTAAFHQLGVSRNEFCSLGCAKNNIGNLDPACCIAALIKVALSLEHRQIPPLIHANPLNRLIKLKDSPFLIDETIRPYQETDEPIRAGINTLGIGGTNVFTVVEAPPRINQHRTAATPNLNRNNQPRLVNFSARNPGSLKRLLTRMENHLNRHRDQLEAADISFTCNTGRGHFEHRASIICRNTHELLDKIRELNQKIKEIAPGEKNIDEKTIFVTDEPYTVKRKKRKEKKTSFLKLFLENREASSGKITLEEDKYINPFYVPGKSPRIIFILPPVSGDTEPPGMSLCNPLLEETLQQLETLLTTERLQEVPPACQEIVLQAVAALTLMSWGIQPDKILAEGTGLYAAASIAQKNPMKTLASFARETIKEEYIRLNSIQINKEALPQQPPTTPLYYIPTHSVPPEDLPGIAITGSPEELSAPVGKTIFISIGPAESGLAEKNTEYQRYLDFPYRAESQSEQTLITPALLYIHGIDLDWVSFEKKNKGLKIPLPPYPFESIPHWL